MYKSVKQQHGNNMGTSSDKMNETRQKINKHITKNRDRMTSPNSTYR